MKTYMVVKPNEPTDYFACKDLSQYRNFLTHLSQYAEHRFYHEYDCSIPNSFEIFAAVRIVCKKCDKAYNKCDCEKEKK